MKYVILGAVLMAAISCSDENETTYSVTPELSTYVDSFFAEASLRGKDLPKQNLIASLNSGCQAITEISKDDEQWVLKFDKEMFEAMAGNPNNKVESMIFHELGRIILKRELTTGASIMNGFVKVNGYSNTERSALLDELFK